MSVSQPPFPPVRACLFDMDGLLINTEDLYSLVTNIVLHKYGKPSLPWSIKAQLQGRPGPESGRILQEWAQLPIPPEQFWAETAALQQEHFPRAAPLPGAEALLKGLQAGGVHLALATSSMKRNFFLKTDHLQEFMAPFAPERRVLGDDERIPRGRGKPAPDIYQLALDVINRGLEEGQRVGAEECLVFEDSVPGVEAGRRAGMRVVWVPHPGLLSEFRGKEESVLAGQTSQTEMTETPEAGSSGAEKAMAGWPGKEGDGWAEMLHSLEEFDYAKYGIKV